MTHYLGSLVEQSVYFKGPAFFQNGMNRKYPLVRPSFTVFCQTLPRKLKRRLDPSSRIETNGK